MALVTFVNVTTILDDARRRGVHMPLALPLTLEITSAVAALAALVIVVIALRIAPPGRGPWWRTLAVHAVGTLAFSVAHVMLMTLLRIVVFALAGHRYDFSLGDLPYEYRKDLLSYLVIGGIFWLVARERERLAVAREAAATEPAAGEPGAAAGPATFDIRDGASILRVGVGEIIAATAAGNYVEFVLDDGRRPLMRASMAQVEAALAPHGFVRTHRSWLVNAARVRALTAAGSGDFRLDLGCGLTAPLSRRYPEALSRLRDGAPSQSSA
ncbi:MAG TPA: LytTR family DNA-binding domain-containing protein [Caulobacteraceae bacterium]|nr:LytTR family DNA-binding domain-containing protein [Caulobacteraceae bacterium]